MDKQHIKACMNLIQKLLTHPNEVAEILKANRELLDEGLLRIMGNYIQIFAKSNDQNAQNDANFLRRLRSQLAESLGISESQFLMETIDKQIYRVEVEVESIKVEAESIEKAITASKNRLKVYTKDAFPVEWAVYQHSLGIAYCDRIKGDRSQNLELAIAAYKNAMEVRTKDAFSHSWAMTQNNLGNAYRKRIKGDIAENLELAITAHKNAMEVFTRDALPDSWAMTQSSLGTDYRERIKGDRAQNLELAITAHKNAMEVFTRDALPDSWAMTQSSLGTDYRERIKGDRGQNLELAIAAHKNAMEVFTRDAFPHSWARTQNGLGNAYRERIKGDRAQNLELAIAAYKNALEVYTPKANPIAYFRICWNLGTLYFEECNWESAIAAYEKAITAVELSRSWSTDDERRQEILKDAMIAYQNIVQACVNANQIEKAIEYVERSRSRRLVDLMASNDLYSKGEIPPEVAEWLEKHEAIQQQINQLWSQQQRDSHTERPELAAATRGRAAMKARNQRIAELEAQKQEVYKKIRSLDRVLAEGKQVTPLKFEKIQALIQEPTTAILSFYTTNDHTYLFVVQQNGVKVHVYSELGFEKLQVWVVENWFMSYLSARPEWQQQMPRFLAEIGKKLELEELCKSYLQDIEELILIPHLDLHLLPWSAMPVTESGDQKYLGDYFRIRTLASCQVLDFCTQRPKITAAPVDYGIVEDTRNDLPCASYEAQHIAKMYGVPDNQRLRGEAATVKSYKLLLSQVRGLLSTHHAQSRIDNCLESALLLADGTITLGQLLSPAFRFPDLDEVFIDCCETNFGIVQMSDDVLTLNTGFLCAGARGVISTLWSVDDLATSLFSIFYHQLRQNGKNRSEALSAAQRQLRELTGKELRKKYRKGLEEVLDEKLQGAYEQLQEIEVRRKSYGENSAEYQELEEERAKLSNIYQRIYRTKNKHLKAVCKEEYPFEHPVYWSAFICAGLS
ncbi:MAG: CHAT domain-containing protein [Okeania sp. SIO3C4]|nr:CHAT domain-containing protein [Okeania sp. SIO3C4]